ncbi:MAG: hypothetical protein A3F54_00870 [Candidatus Kerfeldbacteria bacterium RIFCSPHIGHO2_12_FULL_48_17]|uniref:HTH psq-type domain-containing protein n=1 Tax=Candidatus Kerfeldbacteria bacterium RIFCSPHIGHO2_12_FULL_48_17 TaxID=1798542 RepID=A0A1G2B4J2_9BACT|nr:MAG: hypothetical protein A3F54_00870 [Candidatus Kerfeldbacteria bacterium RIFCSPHIGHO2_12_FULL_48_17]
MNMDIKDSAKTFRKSGKSYTEIQKALGVPKSTLAYWLKDVVLDEVASRRIQDRKQKSLVYARRKALESNQKSRAQYLKKLADRNAELPDLLKDASVAKLTLVMLYWTEGSKHEKGALTFGNSDPEMIRLFLQLLRQVYAINEAKFRCTLQCRADQDIVALQKFWQQITQIPMSQFYKAQVDKRTIGKKSRKQDYKGVCRINYFSAEIFHELRIIVDLLHTGP